MIAIDTNILVRLVTNDDPTQAQRITGLLQDQAVFIPKTVLLELEWVLRFSYVLDRQIILSTLKRILSTENFTIENISAIEQAMQWYEQGLDLADAIHLASSQHADQFISFDKKLIKKARTIKIPMSLVEA